ncbi:MAG: CRISPR-associated protein Cas4 [Permianibacter sp.]
MAGNESDETADQPIPISALQHYLYCPRQCALIHIEQEFEDNVHTARGQAVHSRVNVPESDWHLDRRIERALPLGSQRLGLVGVADVVEFLPDGTPYPVEYKHGRKRGRQADDVQLAAQALCLEEMLVRPVPEGAIYHASSHQRRTVPITADLRQLTEETIAAVRALYRTPVLPPPVNDKRCTDCSLREICQPQALAAFNQRFAAAAVALFDQGDDDAGLA